MNRRAFFKTTVAATTATLSTLRGWGVDEPKHVLSDAEVLAQATDRITKHRQGEGVVIVRGADGRPVPGATVQVEQLRHDFLFGSNFFMFGRFKEPEREEEYRRRFAALLNYATLGFYWGAYEPERGKPNYDYTDKVLEWCRAHGITCKGHPLAWDHPASSPKWLPNDLAEIERLSTSRVREIITRFKGRIDIWDVVNEPTDLKRFKNPMNVWAETLGAVPFVRLHLDVARKANPQATLLVNDYRVDVAFYKVLDALRADGKLLFDTVGIQSHMHGGGWPLAKVWEVCDRYAQLGLPVHFTETTFVSGPRLGSGENWGASTPELEAKQADYVARFYTTLFAHPATQALTWWDFADAGAWQGAAAGFLRKDMSAKPVYDRLHSLIKRDWWTKTEGRTNGNGEFDTRAFFGTHRLTARLPKGPTITKEVHWGRSVANRFELAAR
jgi:GH35 family endo-1,4-beta-xylanase